VLPISWTNIKSLKIIHEKQKEKMYFTNLTEILNTDWTKDIPNFHIKKQIKNYDEYFKNIILDGRPNRLIDDFLGDIIYIYNLADFTNYNHNF